MTPASIVLDLVERVWNGGDLSALPDYYADPFEHDGGTSTVAELLEWHRDQSATWAGTSYAVLDCVASGESVALRWQATSTHVGPGEPGPPTDRRVEWVGAHFFRVENRRIVTMHSFARSGHGILAGVRETQPKLPLNDEGAGS
jgi:predicted ester cyclase